MGDNATGAGAGIEVPIAPHWTARLEYLFTDYGNSGTTFFAGAQRIDSNFALQELRAGGLRDQEYLRLKVLTCMLSSALKLPKTPTRLPENPE